MMPYLLYPLAYLFSNKKKTNDALSKPKVKLFHATANRVHKVLEIWHFSFFAMSIFFSSGPFDSFYHRSLYTWKSVSSLREEFFLQDESSFESNAVTKPVVTQATTRHQIKDMDIISPLTPLNFLWVG